MKLKWTDEELKYFNRKIPVVEKLSWFSNFLDKYYYWIIFACIISANVWVWWKIYELHLFKIFLKSI